MDYGTIRIGRMANATKFPNVTWDDTQTAEINYSKYQIKETDFRVKTATFTSSDFFDITTGRVIVRISSDFHENFAGIILDVEYDENTGLYSYQCQDWSRHWISKFEFAVKNAKLYNVLQFLITQGGVDFKSPTIEELESNKNTLKGLAAIGKYDQSLYEGNLYKTNPMKNKVTVLSRDKTYMEVIRSLVYSQLGFFDVYFKDSGIMQIAPISKKDWENTGLVLSDDEFYNRKFQFNTTNIITGVLVNGTDLTAGTWVMAGPAIGLSLSSFFGYNETSISNPNSNNNSNAVKSTSKSSTKNTSTKKSTMKNPFNNRNKKIMVSADGGSDGFRQKIIDLLHKDGWTVKNLGTGPGTHSASYNQIDKSYAANLTIFNGFCAGTVRECYDGWLKGHHEKKGVQLVYMWDTSGWTEGMKPYRYGDFSGYSASRAWDDNFSSNNPAIKNVMDYMKKYKVCYCCGPTPSQAYSQFKAGGYLKQKGIIK